MSVRCHTSYALERAAGARQDYNHAVTLAIFLLSCTARPPDRYLAYVGGGAEDSADYAITARSVSSLEDARTLDGALGQVFHGGRLVGPVEAARYGGGVSLDVRYALEDGVAVPADQEGLLLYSFYGHLEDARTAVEAHGVDLGPLFPVDMAWNPAVSPLVELSPVDNAAYVVGSNLFVLLPDGDDRDVPLLANAGVVTHELGHAVFHLLQRGDALAEPIVSGGATSEAGLWQASLHEGFADALAALLLDDPRFLTPTLDMPARDMEGDSILTEELLPENAIDTLSSSVVPIYDPYALGTVYASMAWDIRLGLDDPGAALDLLLTGVRRWAPTEAEDMDGFAYLDAIAGSASADQRAVVCDAIARRFGEFHTPSLCE